MMCACPACDAALAQKASNAYVVCPACGTWVLQADAPAGEDNAAYFNAHFREKASAQPDERKRRIFQAAEQRDHARRAAEQDRFLTHVQNLQAQLLQPGQRVLEIGFGDGDVLARLLQSGVDAWGEDLALTAVRNFQEQHPGYARRAGLPGATAGAFHLIYAAALFEHLDDPRVFLHDIQKRLQPGGRLVLDQIPLASAGPADLSPADDICFWKPCHRVLHSLAGLQQLAGATGFRVLAVAAMDSFNYRVLSLHRRAGYPAIETLRNACLVDARLPGLLRYRWLCWRAQHIRSRCQVASVVLQPLAADTQGAPT